MDKDIKLEGDNKSLQIDNNPDGISEEEHDILDKDGADSITQETVSITRGPSPARLTGPATIINSLSKLPPKYSAPKAKRMKDINLMLYKPYGISRIHIDRKSYELDKDFWYKEF